MVLFNEVVEVFALTDLDARLSFGIVACDRRCVGTTLVDRDLLRICRKLYRTDAWAMITGDGSGGAAR
jgi:hypothetical protein